MQKESYGLCNEDGQFWKGDLPYNFRYKLAGRCCWVAQDHVWKPKFTKTAIVSYTNKSLMKLKLAEYNIAKGNISNMPELHPVKIVSNPVITAIDCDVSNEITGLKLQAYLNGIMSNILRHRSSPEIIKCISLLTPEHVFVAGLVEKAIWSKHDKEAVYGSENFMFLTEQGAVMYRIAHPDLPLINCEEFFRGPASLTPFS